MIPHEGKSSPQTAQLARGTKSTSVSGDQSGAIKPWLPHEARLQQAGHHVMQQQKRLVSGGIAAEQSPETRRGKETGTGRSGQWRTYASRKKPTTDSCLIYGWTTADPLSIFGISLYQPLNVVSPGSCNTRGATVWSSHPPACTVHVRV